MGEKENGRKGERENRRRDEETERLSIQREKIKINATKTPKH